MAETNLTEAQIRAQLPQVRERGLAAAASEFRARAARYNPDTGRIDVELTNGCLFAFPAEHGEGLRGATPQQLANVEVYPGGVGLHWDDLDADLSVAGLMSGVFGTQAWMRELGRAGGRARSDAKARAARENGRKGGRPRKAAGGQG
jgi:hypothetical protein